MTVLHRPDRPQTRPVVSVIIANFNGADFLADAIRSVQQQTLHDIEIIVSDDGSSDGSVGIVAALMANDPRISLLRSERNRGPAAARNKAIAAAEGEWIAVIDADDLMHPERLARLVDAGHRDGADLIADNVIEFHQDGSTKPRPMLTGRWLARPHWVDAVAYIRANLFYVRGPALGYLKPLFRRSILNGTFRYDESLTIGEDYDLVARLLRSGRKLRVYPEPLYYYRKHHASLTRRPDTPALKALEAANVRFLNQSPISDRRMIAAVRLRMRSMETAFLFHDLLAALKAGRWAQSVRIAIRRPRAAALLRLPIRSRLRALSAAALPRSTAAASRARYAVPLQVSREGANR
jgi:succinoglycan biosynthesis protein ExoO